MGINPEVYKDGHFSFGRGFIGTCKRGIKGQEEKHEKGYDKQFLELTQDWEYLVFLPLKWRDHLIHEVFVRVLRSIFIV